MSSKLLLGLRKELKVQNVRILRLNVQLPTLRQLCEPGVGHLAKCLGELQALERKLAPPSWGGPVGSKRRALIQALG
jgi:hypothetical protein